MSHRDSHETPKPLKPGQFYDVTVELNEIAQTVPAGAAPSSGHINQLLAHRLAVAGAGDGDCRSRKILDRTPGPEVRKGLAQGAFKPAVKSAPAPVTVKDSGAETRHMILDIERQRMNFTIRRNDGSYVIDEIGTEISLTKLKDFAVSRDGKEPPRSLVATTVHYRRGDWDARTETEVSMTSDKTHFHMESHVRYFRRRQALHESQTSSGRSSGMACEALAFREGRAAVSSLLAGLQFGRLSGKREARSV